MAPLLPQASQPFRRPAAPAALPVQGMPGGLMPFQSQGAAITPEMLAFLDQLLQQQQSAAPAPAAPAPAAAAPPVPRMMSGVDPSTFARPVDMPEEGGGLWDWLSQAWEGNRGNNQQLALSRMISGSRRG